MQDTLVPPQFADDDAFLFFVGAIETPSLEAHIFRSLISVIKAFFFSITFGIFSSLKLNGSNHIFSIIV